MKINEAIAKCDLMYPNTITDTDKINLLSQLDGRIKAEIYDKYDINEGDWFTGYPQDTPQDTDLLVPFPFDNIYVSWLVANMYLIMGEHNSYNDWLTIFNNEWDSYERYFAFNHSKREPADFKYF